jgi:hypothetical protein
VCFDGGPSLLVGRDAIHAGWARPEGLEPNPKRCIDDGAVQLAGAEFPVQELIGAVLAYVAAQARSAAGEPPTSTRLTYPAGWGARRREVLHAATERAGLANVTLLAEPVAAAAYFVEVVQGHVPVGSCLVVYDLGAGTFDASVVRRADDSYEVLAQRGLANAGGLDIDAAVVAYLGTVYSVRDRHLWDRLMNPSTAGGRRASRQLWDGVRSAKELLSRRSSVSVHIPLFDDEAPLGREQLEQLARPILDRTVHTARTTIRESGIRPDEIAGLFVDVQVPVHQVAGLLEQHERHTVEIERGEEVRVVEQDADSVTGRSHGCRRDRGGGDVLVTFGVEPRGDHATTDPEVKQRRLLQPQRLLRDLGLDLRCTAAHRPRCRCHSPSATLDPHRGESRRVIQGRCSGRRAGAATNRPAAVAPAGTRTCYALVFFGTPTVASSTPAIAARSASGIPKARAISPTRTGCGLCRPVRAATIVALATAPGVQG